MTRQEFLVQIQRLIKNFNRAYSTELTEMLWQEVRGTSLAEWESFVTDQIGSSRVPPLLPEVREQMTAWREDERRKAKRAETDLSKQGWQDPPDWFSREYGRLHLEAANRASAALKTMPVIEQMLPPPGKET